MIGRKITAQDLLSLCLGCGECKGVFVEEDGTLSIHIDNGNDLWLRNDTHGEESLTFSKGRAQRDSTKINTVDELKEAMRHYYYKYDV